MQEDVTTRSGYLEYLALAAAVAQDVAGGHVRGALDEATKVLDRLGTPLSIPQRALLSAAIEEAVEGIALCALALAVRIVHSENEAALAVPLLREFTNDTTHDNAGESARVREAFTRDEGQRDLASIWTAATPRKEAVAS